MYILNVKIVLAKLDAEVLLVFRLGPYIITAYKFIHSFCKYEFKELRAP